MTPTSSIRLAIAAALVAFGLSAAHAELHEFETPGAGLSLHGVACDDAHAEPRCPVCLGNPPSRSVHRSPISSGRETARPGFRALQASGVDPLFTNRFARPEAARAPPLHG